MNNIIIISSALGIIAISVLLIKLFKVQIISFLLRLRTKYVMNTLRDAIHQADADKSATGRKNMVVYNSDTKMFEPIQKRKLKAYVAYNKRKKRRGLIDNKRIHSIEKKSLYVTR
jgi:hypothetical protein